MKIPFSPPFIDEDVIAEVTDTLKSGWITTGPKVKELERLVAGTTGVSNCVCVNSWTSGALLTLKWLGIGAGDEVIIPAYTYAATALCVIHAGATPVMVDILDDFSIDVKRIRQAITPRTKAIIPVDIAGWPCDYDAIMALVEEDSVKAVYQAGNAVQQQLGRVAVIADAAHSFGCTYNGKSAALAADVTIFSFHAVKNITAAEGGAICLNLPAGFDAMQVYSWMKLNSSNGQTKDAFTKLQYGSWRYDIVSDGLKINMPDVCAAIALAQLRRYQHILLPERKRITAHYTSFFSNKPWAIVPALADGHRESSHHLFLLRIKDITEQQRDAIIQMLADKDVAVNVHFIPLPMLTLFNGMGYDIKNYPVAYKNFICELSLPVYPQLTNEQCTYLEQQLEIAYNEIVNDEIF